MMSARFLFRRKKVAKGVILFFPEVMQLENARRLKSLPVLPFCKQFPKLLSEKSAE